MAQTPSTWDDYVGDDVEDTFQITFPYQKQQEVFVTVDGAPAAFTFISAGWVKLAVVPVKGAAIRVQRSTEASEPRHEFANGVPLLPRFIDENNKQFLYVAQEAVNETAAITAEAVNKVAAATEEARAVAEGVRAVAEEARAMAEGAVDIAEGAVDIAQAASDKVDAAVIESAHQLRLNLADSTDPAKGAGMVGYKGHTVAQELGELGELGHTVAQKLDGLGTAATADLTTSPEDGTAGRVLRVGDGGWMGQGFGRWSPYGYPSSIGDVTNQTKVIRCEVLDNGVEPYSAGIHFAAADTWGRLRVRYDSPGAWIQGGCAGSGPGWTEELLHTGNLLQTTGTSTELPMSQAAVTNAINSSSIGIGQTWQDVTTSRAVGTTYTNTTGRPIQLSVTFDPMQVGSHFQVDGVDVLPKNDVGYYHVFCVVPAGATYRMVDAGVAITLKWVELR